MKLKKLIKRNYQAVVDRGLITKDTFQEDFLHKLFEETQELEKEVYSDNSEEYLYSELGDCLTVILNWCYHFNIDVKKLLLDTAKKNEKRKIKQ